MGKANFKDPVGLFKRMLLSGNKVAYFILLREAVGKLVIPLDFLLGPLQKRLLSKASRSDDPVILIVGGSRNGTTLVYQYLSKYLDVSYVNNFNALFKRAPLAALWMFRSAFKKRFNEDQNYFGSVSGFGAPNEAFMIWDRWFGTDHRNIECMAKPEDLKSMDEFFQVWNGITKKPFLNKNNRNLLCIKELNENLSNVFFIEVHRDPIYVAQSLILSRKVVQGGIQHGWGVMGNDTNDAQNKEKNGIEEVCRQVYSVDEKLRKTRSAISPERYLRVSYEEFCEQPHAIIHRVASRILNQEEAKKQLLHIKKIKSTNQQRVDDTTFGKIKECLKELYKEPFPNEISQ